MTVSVGDIILADHYNTIRTAVNKWFGDNSPSSTPSDPKTTTSYGWGGTNAASVAIGDTITAEQVNHLINRVNLAVSRVGAGSTLTKVATGEVIEATDFNGIETQAATIEASSTESADHTITSGGSDGTSLYTGSWNQLTYDVTITFASYAEARYFFNSGGQFRFSFGITGGNEETDAWADLFDSSDMGTLIFSIEDFDQTGTRMGNVTTGSGFYELTTSYVELYDINLDISPYQGSDFRVQGQRSSDGATIYLKFLLNNDDPQANAVNGDVTLYVDNRTANDVSTTDPTVSLSISPPTSVSISAYEN